MKIESILKKLAMLTMLGAFVLGTGMVVGCEQSEDPADAIGAAAEDAADAAEGAAEDAEDAVKEGADAAENAINEAAGN